MNNIENVSLADAIDVIEEILSSGGDFKMFPRGTSMLPLIKQNIDSVVIKRHEGPLKKHDIAFYRRADGSFVLHRVMKVCRDGRYVMCGDNQTRLERGVPHEAVIAVVTRICKKDKELSLSSVKYRLYKFFWTKMPIRRAVFLIRRILRRLFKRKK